MTPTPAFTRSVAANVAYWRTRLTALDDLALRTLDRDRHNLRRAAAFGLQLDATWRDTAGLLLEAFPFIERRGYWRAWIPLFEGLLASHGADEPALHGKLLHCLGALCRQARRLDDALAYHDQEESLGLRVGDRRLLAKAHLNRCQTLWRLRRHEAAEAEGRAALKAFQALGIGGEEHGAALNMLGLIAQARGEPDAAGSYLRQAVQWYRRMDRPVRLARALMNLGITLEAQGNTTGALAAYRESEVLLAPTDCELDKVKVALSLGTLYFNQADLASAEAAYRRADSPFLRDAGQTYYRAMVANNLGNLYLAQGRLAEAERWLRRSLGLWRRAGARLMLANSAGTLAETVAARGQRDAAIPLYEEALAIARAYPGDAWAGHLGARFQRALAALRADVATPGQSM